MTVFADFIPIVGDEFVQVNKTGGGNDFPLGTFTLDGARRDQTVLLMLAVRFLEGRASIVLNGRKVGVIVRNSSPQWMTQHVLIGGNCLAADGSNQIALRDVTDLLQIKNCVCFFHQGS